MADKKRYELADRARSVLRWLAWKPWRIVVAIVAVIVVWFVLTHLGGRPAPPEPSVAPSTTQAGLPSDWQNWPTTQASPAMPAPVNPGISAPPAVWDAASRQAVLDTAVAAVTAYTTGDQDGLDKIVGWDVAITVNPAPAIINTPDPQSPGVAVPYVTSEDSPLSTIVVVPTSIGDYKVSLNRLDGVNPWRVQTITEPGQ
ncbi:MAG: hypothetical protein FWF25_01355 [Propionibacteriaceae bacterium]|nr:hypothetical protein [Propionibacteriaceae bacterium]